MAYKVFTNGSVLNASEINDNLMNQSVIVFSNAAARTAAITSPVEGQVTYLEDTNQLFIYSGSAWVAIATSATNAYNLVQTLYYTSSGTFTKATYPWLRAIKVKVQGAGGGGGGCATTAAGGVALGAPGGGGVYAESFITDIAGLASSVTVTRGAAGSGGAAGVNNGANGGTSSFGSLVSANGGNGGAGGVAFTPYNQPTSGPSTTGVGDLIIAGGAGAVTIGVSASSVAGGVPGTSFMGNTPYVQHSSNSGVSADANQYGAGGGGGINSQSQGTARSGGAGGPGIVIVELYA